ncbi:MAG: hypothetical protein JST83_04090 [Bacteroidetes bacterium]|nr:hypothetical protein [Bacteroidota bacterium]
MNTVVIREKLHGYVDNGDEKLVKLLFALAKEYVGDEDYEFSDEELKEFEKRRQDRINGSSKTYSWDEAKARIISGNVSDL